MEKKLFKKRNKTTNDIAMMGRHFYWRAVKSNTKKCSLTIVCHSHFVSVYGNAFVMIFSLTSEKSKWKYKNRKKIHFFVLKQHIIAYHLIYIVCMQLCDTHNLSLSHSLTSSTGSSCCRFNCETFTEAFTIHKQCQNVLQHCTFSIYHRITGEKTAMNPVSSVA